MAHRKLPAERVMSANENLSENAQPRWSVRSLFGGPAKPAPAPTPAAEPEPVLPPNARRILIVDDDEVIRKAMSMKLKASGYAVSTAADGPSAIHAARSEHPDLILLDLSFPPDVALTWDGFSILAWLRRLDATKNIPVIIVTGNHTENLSQRAQSSGAAGFFHKPLDFRPLLSLIELRLKQGTTPVAPARTTPKD